MEILKQLEFVLPYMANRKRRDTLQYSDDEMSQPQFENIDTLSSENFEICNVEPTKEANDDVETENF